jgi:hypothetical protein
MIADAVALDEDLCQLRGYNQHIDEEVADVSQEAACGEWLMGWRHNSWQFLPQQWAN